MGWFDAFWVIGGITEEIPPEVATSCWSIRTPKSVAEHASDKSAVGNPQAESKARASDKSSIKSGDMQYIPNRCSALITVA